MKKTFFIFSLFLGIFGAFFMLQSNPCAYADNETISVVARNGYGQTLTLTNNSFFTDYGSLEDDFSITLDAQVTSGIMQWKKGNVVLSNEKSLTLYKSTQNTDNLLLVGNTIYTFTVTSEEHTSEVRVQISVTDNDNSMDLIFSRDNESVTTVTKASPSITFKSILPTAKSHTINFYLKVPNQSEYSIVSENTSTYTFDPSKVLNNENGFGNYCVMAVATEKISSSETKTYYSDVVLFSYTEALPDFTPIKIKSEIVKNTKARVEANKFTLEDADALNTNFIQWYVGDTLQCVGKSFIYEPKSTDLYRVTAKYATSESLLIEIDSVRIQPNPTGTDILILYIAGIVVAISIVFGISIYIFNKKRDVVW